MLKGIPVRQGKGPETPHSVGGDGVVGRGAVHSQQEGLVAPEDEGSPGRGRAVAPCATPLGEPGRDPPMVVGAKDRVEWAGKDVVARGGQETKRAGCVLGGEQGKANAGDREVVPPREETTADGGGVLTEGRVALRGRSLSVGVVGGDQGAACMGEGVVDLEACMGEADAGILQGTEPPHGIWAADGGLPCRRIHLVQQGVKPGAGDVGVEVAGGGGGRGHGP